MSDSVSHDRPWRRPGALRYGLRRVRNAVRPPVTIYPAPDDMIKDADVPVVMRDGVTLRVNVYRPAGDGPFPVLLSAHPYGKDALPVRTRFGWKLNFQYRIMNQPAPFRVSSETGWEAPDPAVWTSRGYVVVNADLRGAGTSEGTGSLLSDAEALDVHDLIEWAGRQSWSTGAVGMLGVSYLALSQYKAAALHPPHLAAICPWEGFTDLYRDFMKPGGVDERGFSRIWALVTRKAARLSEDIGAERRRHPLRDDWWQSKTPDLAAIEVPMLVCASFSDSNLHSAGSMRAFERAGSAHKYLYTHRGPKWAMFYSDVAVAAQHAFFERHLRGDTTRTLPRVRLEVRGSRTEVTDVREEHEWPPAAATWTELRVADGDRLTRDTGGGVASGSSVLDLRGAGLAYDLAIDSHLELSGPMSARLWVSLPRGGDATLFVAVEKWAGTRWVPFEGSYGYGRDRIVTGRQKLSLRALDRDASSVARPVHSFDRVQLLEPGQIVEIEVGLGSSATSFMPGDRLRLVIAGRSIDRGNPLTGHFPARYQTGPRGTCRIHRGGDHPSMLTVPLIEATNPAAGLNP
ncbi:CocE/NonD family hydrolase [Gordonia hongkongensis]|uniref:CocE/NonD family hydrolase n=1 Tax=Gordonia hongkongensis TaxID=1701090 RepID=UPI001FFBBC69|nr:CocE/NonD family hydrolase [Gordonia hongkongensis]UPG67138.1 CocE/NonD family hydrolase [Gordonia hongkongensis]